MAGMSRFCDGNGGGDDDDDDGKGDGNDNINFHNIEFDELINALASRMKFSLHLKWLHDQLQFWKEEITQSTLFDESEIKTILPILIPYICQLFRNWNIEDYEMFLRCVDKDTIWRYELYQNYEWKCLLVEHEKKTCNYDEEDQEERMTQKCDSNTEICSSGTNLSLGPTNSEEYKLFNIKLHYLLNLIFSNNFQYTLYKIAFSPGNKFEDYELTSPYPLYFLKKYFSVEVPETPRKTKPEAGKPKTKEKKLNLPKPPPLEIPKPEVKKDDIQFEKTILPLNMAYEIDKDFWKEFEEKYPNENPINQGKGKKDDKAKEKSKEGEQKKPEPEAKPNEEKPNDQKKEKKKGKK